MNDPINDDNFNFTEQREAQLTAYALGELDEHERALVERRLEHDAEARAIVAQVRELATTLTAELAAEPMPRLSEPQREALRAEHPTRLIGVMKSRTVSLRTRLWFGAGLSAAACLAIAVTALTVNDSARKSEGRKTDSLLALGKSAQPMNEPAVLGDRLAAETKAPAAQDAAAAPKRVDRFGWKAGPKEVLTFDFDASLMEQGQTNRFPAPTADASGPSSTVQLGQELAMRKSDEQVLRHPFDQLATGQSPAPAAAPGGVSSLFLPDAPGTEKNRSGGDRVLSVTGASISPSGERGSAGSGGSGGGSGGGGGNSATGAIESRTYNLAASPPATAGRPAQSGDAFWSNEVHAKFKSADEEYAERARRIPWLGDVPLLCPPFSGQPNTETYNRIVDNPFLAVTENPLSTFSIDVDTGSYANVRRFLLQNNTLPPPDAVRIEELINYFPLAAAGPAPESEHPFAVHVDMWEAPWNGEHHLARVTIKGREVKMDQRPATSLVFLIDVSGSMQPTNKLPLLKQSMKMLVDQLHGDDRLAIVTYAGASGLALPSTFASDKQRILGAIDNLNAGGSTNGAAGIQLAYQVAAESFIPGGVNRVILATDGDFNVGVSDDASLIRLIEEKRTTGVHLSVLGFGEGNLKDAKMEQLANHGNGEYAYIDSAREGRKVLVEQAAGTLVTIAKDVKIQIEFNPAQVASYRLIGYENRVLAKEDFNNDAKDAGEIGAGHCVTALYEIVSANADVAGVPAVDALKYQKPAVQPTDAATNSGELMTIKLRYKQPDGAVSKLIEMPVPDMRGRLGRVPDDMRFLTAVAEFGMLLRNSPYKGNANFAQVLDLAEGARGEDVGGYRAEFIELVNRAKALRGQ